MRILIILLFAVSAHADFALVHTKSRVPKSVSQKNYVSTPVGYDVVEIPDGTDIFRVKISTDGIITPASDADIIASKDRKETNVKKYFASDYIDILFQVMANLMTAKGVDITKQELKDEVAREINSRF